MGCGENFAAYCGFGCLFTLTLALQGTGLFSPRWVVKDVGNQTDCHLGLVMGSGCDGMEGNFCILKTHLLYF